MRKFLTGCACLLCLFVIIAVCPQAAFPQQEATAETDSDAVAINLKKVSSEKNDVVSTEKETTPTKPAAAVTVEKKADTVAVFDEKNEFSVWGGFAPDMPRVFGGSRPSSYGQVALRYSRRIATSDYFAIKYTIDFIPIAVLNYDRRPVIQTSPTTIAVQPINETAYAWGLTPVGFQLHLRRRSSIQPFISANAGLLVFNKTIPDDRSAVFPDRFGRQVNFTLAGGGGVDFLTESGRTFTLGFKFHHISNSSTGNINPGYDQNLFYVGYTFKKW
jgi:Lipid A 3-O-deacylase (PagL)